MNLVRLDPADIYPAFLTDFRVRHPEVPKLNLDFESVIKWRDWEIAVDEEGYPYYFNNVTGESRWDTPSGWGLSQAELDESEESAYLPPVVPPASSQGDELIQKQRLISPVSGSSSSPSVTPTNAIVLSSSVIPSLNVTSSIKPDLVESSQVVLDFYHPEAPQVLDFAKDKDAPAFVAQVLTTWGDWAIFDDDEGYPYYFNRISGESRWNAPPGWGSPLSLRNPPVKTMEDLVNEFDLGRPNSSAKFQVDFDPLQELPSSGK